MRGWLDLVRLLPFVAAILVVGCSVATIVLFTHIHQWLDWFLLILGAVLELGIAMGLIKYLFVQKLHRD